MLKVVISNIFSESSLGLVAGFSNFVHILHKIYNILVVSLDLTDKYFKGVLEPIYEQRKVEVLSNNGSLNVLDINQSKF